MITCVLVDDEPPARERLRALLAQTETPVAVIGEAGSGQDAVTIIHELKPDVVFLDIQMPVLDGFDVVELLPRPRPRIVFVTAYDRYALRAFEVHALDYLTKPVRLGRLKDTLQRLAGESDPVRERNGIAEALRGRPTGPLTRLGVHVGRRLRIVSTDDVRAIEARDKLVYADLGDGSYPIDFTLDDLELRLDSSRFIRIHRSFIVNLVFVRELIPWFAGAYVVKLDGGAQLPVARRRVRDVKRLLGARREG